MTTKVTRFIGIICAKIVDDENPEITSRIFDTKEKAQKYLADSLVEFGPDNVIASSVQEIEDTLVIESEVKYF